jgi:hypothetical protein
MSTEEHICATCGLPIGRSSSGVPVWTPQIKGVEVCGCGNEEEQLEARTAKVHEELVELEHELDELKHRKS